MSVAIESPTAGRPKRAAARWVLRVLTFGLDATKTVPPEGQISHPRKPLPELSARELHNAIRGCVIRVKESMLFADTLECNKALVRLQLLIAELHRRDPDAGDFTVEHDSD